MSIDELYMSAKGHPPYDYQRNLAQEHWPDLLDIPTGLGKTAAVTLAWVYKRGWHTPGTLPDSHTPRRLIWCLPMRVLVEQTHEAICDWLTALNVYGQPGESKKIAVQVLMGGEDGMRGWTAHPEQDQIIIGTQDMLLSRALMRGYGMSRYQWTMDYALLHNDALWVFDEIQLMGAGLATSAQLEAFRRTLPLARNSRSLWVSATLNREWLDTIDLRPHLVGLATLTLNDTDRKNSSVQKRLCAKKSLLKSTVEPVSANKGDLTVFTTQLAEQVHQAHIDGGPTLVVLNTVDRAQQLTLAINKLKPGYEILVVHSRFRSEERSNLNKALRRLSATDNTLIIATQAVEAGVDISASRLFTELAPWSSLVQRFGRCNRGGEWKNASIHWIDLTDDKLAAPYTSEQLDAARTRLAGLTSAASQDLPGIVENRPPTPVVRRRDMIDLFNTDPDLSGFDIDVSVYIRDNDQPPPVQVFWRDLDSTPDKDEPLPSRNELCPTSIGKIKEHLGKEKSCWQWDALARTWTAVAAEQLRPGMTVMLKTADGGYSRQLGFVAKYKPKKNDKPEQLPPESTTRNAMGADPESTHNSAVALEIHLHDTQQAALALLEGLNQQQHKDAITNAALWHDVGKAHTVFQSTLHGTAERTPLLAKSPSKNRHNRKYFRHELASVLSWLANGKKDEEYNLTAYLIAAHHGKVRMSIRAMPDEEPPNDSDLRFARGIYEGDELPDLNFAALKLPKTTLSLQIMELGHTDSGDSWTSRTQNLLSDHGPFVLSWLETLVRIADWRASENPSSTIANLSIGAKS